MRRVRRTSVDIEGAPTPTKASQTAHKATAKADEGKGSTGVTAEECAAILTWVVSRDPLGYCNFRHAWDVVEVKLNELYGEWRLTFDFNSKKFKQCLAECELKLHEESGCLSTLNKARLRLADARRLDYARKRGIILPTKFSPKARARTKVLDEIGV